MQTTSIGFEITPGDAKKMLPDWENRWAELRIETERVARQVTNLRGIAALDPAGKADDTPQLFVTPPTKNSRDGNRAMNGSSQKVLIEFLRLQQGEWVRMKIFLQGTKIPPSTGQPACEEAHCRRRPHQETQAHLSVRRKFNPSRKNRRAES